MKLNWNFLGGEGVQNKNLPWKEYGFFLEFAISFNNELSILGEIPVPPSYSRIGYLGKICF